MVSTNGIDGGRIIKIKTHKRFYRNGATIIMCSDGISTKWDFSNYLEIRHKNSAFLSNLIMRYLGKKNDSPVMVAYL